MVGDEKGEDRLKAVSFAAGTAAFMACIERAVMVSVLSHWRVWVFLALNLLLLAILFTSKYQIPLDQIDGEDFSYAKFLKKKKAMKKKKKKTRRRECVSINGGGEVATLMETVISVNDETKKEEDDDGKKEGYDDLSEEELKEKVEEFIARFKQHLVSDAKGTKVIL